MFANVLRRPVWHREIAMAQKPWTSRFVLAFKRLFAIARIVEMHSDMISNVDIGEEMVQYCGQNLGRLFGNNTIVAKGFVLRAGFFQTQPVS